LKTYLKIFGMGLIQTHGGDDSPVNLSLLICQLHSLS